MHTHAHVCICEHTEFPGLPSSQGFPGPPCLTTRRAGSFQRLLSGHVGQWQPVSQASHSTPGGLTKYRAQSPVQVDEGLQGRILGPVFLRAATGILAAGQAGCHWQCGRGNQLQLVSPDPRAVLDRRPGSGNWEPPVAGDILVWPVVVSITSMLVSNLTILQVGHRPHHSVASLPPWWCHAPASPALPFTNPRRQALARSLIYPIPALPLAYSRRSISAE